LQLSNNTSWEVPQQQQVATSALEVNTRQPEVNTTAQEANTNTPEVNTNMEEVNTNSPAFVAIPNVFSKSLQE